MIDIRRQYNKDIGLQDVETLNGYTFSPEANAHKFIIEQRSNNQTVPFTGTVFARLVRSDSVAVVMNRAGVTGIENGEAFVRLTKECYDSPGRFLLVILVATETAINCVYAARGTALDAQGRSEIIGDGSVTIDELQQAIADARAAIQEAEDVKASIPQDYSALTGEVADLKSADKHLWRSG